MGRVTCTICGADCTHNRNHDCRDQAVTVYLSTIARLETRLAEVEREMDIARNAVCERDATVVPLRMERDATRAQLATLTAERDEAKSEVLRLARALAEWQERARDGEETIAKLRAVAEAAMGARVTLQWLLPSHAKRIDRDGTIQDPCGIHDSHAALTRTLAALDDRKETENG